MSRSGARILLAGESPTHAKFMRLLLEEAGCQVEVVSNGREGLERAKEAPPDLILSNVVMADMDGYAFCRAMRSERKTQPIPFVMLTSLRKRKDRIRALDAGADDFVSKPVDPPELLARVRSLLRVKALYDQVVERGLEVQRQSEQLARTNAEPRELTVTLEDRVAERTAELQAKNDEIRAMTQQLWQAAKLATMGELAASIAHELNNPLATVSLRVESLLAQIPAEDPKRRSLTTIAGEVERMGGLIAHLLDYSRRSYCQISTADVRQEIGATLELIHYHFRDRGVVVVREFDPDVPPVHADRQQLRQLFLNLFTNAADAMPNGGTLTIRVKAVRLDTKAEPEPPGEEPPDARATRLAPFMVIEVGDTGVGIASEDLPNVTEPFFTTKPEGRGTGLGLAICRRIAQEHGGTLEITSERGVGTTIRITLPAGNSS